VVVEEVGCGLAMKGHLQRKSTKLRGMGGAPLTSVLLSTAVAVTPLP
jgi:hypothetical protein